MYYTITLHQDLGVMDTGSWRVQDLSQELHCAPQGTCEEHGIHLVVRKETHTAGGGHVLHTGL